MHRWQAELLKEQKDNGEALCTPDLLFEGTRLTIRSGPVWVGWWWMLWVYAWLMGGTLALTTARVVASTQGDFHLPCHLSCPTRARTHTHTRTHTHHFFISHTLAGTRSTGLTPKTTLGRTPSLPARSGSNQSGLWLGLGRARWFSALATPVPSAPLTASSTSPVGGRNGCVCGRCVCCASSRVRERERDCLDVRAHAGRHALLNR